jgi:exodeoxyribonuclease-3
MTTILLNSWNVNGIRAAQRKGFLDWLYAVEPDILCVQETKAQPHQLDQALRQPEGYTAFWVSAEQKGYSGVALFSKQDPFEIEVGLGIDVFDREGRTIIAHYDEFTLLTTYVPNGARDLSRVPFKMEYKQAFLERCQELWGQGRSLVLCGDFNTAHREIDLARPRQNQNHTGFLPEERAWIDSVLQAGYIDTFRATHPDETGAYTWWAYWGNARPRNVGWRLDYFFVTPDLWEKVVRADIFADVEGSDHCPIGLTLEL